ncbi:MAG: sugar phosphate isomerase/epimerase [Bacillota bacterium]|nr:sugar phosphate isomerase/epimerase [Bacillota bacterium]
MTEKRQGKIGVQLSMLRDAFLADGVTASMAKLAELGFFAVEISQLPMTPENVAAFKSSAAEHGIEIAALSAQLESQPGRPGENLTDDYDKIVADCHTLGSRFLRIGMLPLQYMGSRDSALAFTQRCEEMAERLAGDGIELYYHNHHVEFVKYDGQTLLDLIRDNTKRLGFELDVHWIWRGGYDPVEVIKAYSGRVTLLHLKDYRIAPLVLPEGSLKDMSGFMRLFTDVVQFAEVGAGSLDMPAIIEAGYDAGSRYFLIEQDTCYGRDPWDSLAESGENLKRMGYADWF